MDSRSLDFAEEVMAITNGEGVDLVLNSLAGEFIPKGISTLRAGGRFLEIGKVDILQNTRLGLQLLDNNIAFFAIDLSKLILNEPALIRALWQEAVSYFTNFAFKPLPLKVFPIAEVVEAFRYMAQAKHIGKVVVSLETDEVLVAPAREPATFAAAGTYLISGGAGGLGLAVAQWLVERGAGHLVLMGRSGASAAAQVAIDAMAEAGAEVRVVQADVAQAEQVAQVLDEIRESMPPLRGVIHAAGVLDDGILLQLNSERFRKVMAPKIDGAWNLHKLTLDDPLDLFVLFSSGASVLGSPGQGNYVAANAFLDALAHQRRALGLPAATINWGAWAEVGLATRADRVQHLTQQGIVPFTPEQGVALMGRILATDQVQMMAVSMDWKKLLDLYAPPFLSYLAEEVAAEAGPSERKEAGLIRAELLAVAPRERQQVAELFLREQIARVLRSSPEKIDLHQPLTSLGIDSLMAVELKNRVESEMGIALPVTALLQGPTLAQLATVLLEQLTKETLEAAEPMPGPANLSLTGEESEAAVLAKLDELSDEEVDELLQEMLEAEGGEIEQVIEGIS
jgi:NAD(P)-dependent dehydrogenase (short-subunit alcohol dehydrogenase family)/acyl carrier protein